MIRNDASELEFDESRKALIESVSGNFYIVASTFNPELVGGLLDHCLDVLESSEHRTCTIFRVPGAFEIPAVAAKCIDLSPKPDAIICLGAVIQGETSHAEQITSGVTNALAHLQITHKIPVIHGVGHFNNLDQAQQRCSKPSIHNRGVECAIAALEMTHLFHHIQTL